MEITHEHQQLFDTTKQFVEKEINPHADEWERAGMWPAREVFQKMGALGLLALFGYLSVFAVQALRLLPADRIQAALYLALFMQQAITAHHGPDHGAEAGEHH